MEIGYHHSYIQIKGSVEEITNYRPISILPTFRKILESAIKEQVVTYLSDSKLICNRQSTYLSGHLTQTSLHSIIDRRNSALDSKQLDASCSLNLVKGFGTIAHHVFLSKLKLLDTKVKLCHHF